MGYCLWCLTGMKSFCQPTCLLSHPFLLPPGLWEDSSGQETKALTGHIPAGLLLLHSLSWMLDLFAPVPVGMHVWLEEGAKTYEKLLAIQWQYEL